MLSLQDLHLAFGGRVLFDGLGWTVRGGERVGLVGPNGAGKSTLLRVIAGEQSVDRGEVVYEGGATVGFLRQDTQEEDLSISPLEEALHAFDDVRRLEAEAQELTAAMEAGDPTSDDYFGLVERFSKVQDRLVTREAHTAESRAAAILSGLGFSDDEMRRPLSTFSGGWRMRVALARLLLGAPDVLLLDEPTNHLDIESIDWLEQYLTSYPGAVVLVSHDRYFLDRMTTSTADLVRGQIDSYPGNYAHYLEARVERRVHWQSRYDNQQKEIAEAERFIARFRAKATKAKQAQSRIKMLEKLERIPPPPPEAGAMRFRFPDPPASGRQVVELSAFSKRYPAPEPQVGGSQGGTTAVFDHAGPLALERGDKVALVGKNGAGKSTLARILLGTEAFDGERTVDRRAEMAHFAQHQAEALEPSHTVFQSLQEKSRGHSDTELRSILGAFLFSGTDSEKSVSVLSGGERSRLALARTLLSPANVLVLDEPTNHLDIVSKKRARRGAPPVHRHVRAREPRPRLYRRGRRVGVVRRGRGRQDLQRDLHRGPMATRARHAGPAGGPWRRRGHAVLNGADAGRLARAVRQRGASQVVGRQKVQGAEAPRGRGPQRAPPDDQGRQGAPGQDAGPGAGGPGAGGPGADGR